MHRDARLADERSRQSMQIELEQERIGFGWVASALDEAGET